jgi:hypothetical protein
VGVYALSQSPVMELADALHGLTPQGLAELIGAHVTTARRWLRSRQVPRAVAAALMVLRFGDLGAISPDWEGWSLREGVLWSPEGDGFSPPQVRAAPLYERAAEEYRAQLQAALKAAESDQERAERVAALAALANAHAAAGAALARLAGGLTPAEDRRLFEALDNTRRRRERAGLLDDSNAPAE